MLFKMTSVETAPAPRRRGRPPANREKLIQGALKCLREKGYANTTARDLVEASGTNLASIGYHFGSKEALLNEAISRGMATWTETVEREVFAKAYASPDERLKGLLSGMIDRFDELRPYLLSFVEAFAPAVRSPELRESMADAYREARRAGRRMFEWSLEENGAPGRSAEAAVLASLLLAVCDGLILQWLLEPGSTPSSDEVIEALRVAIPVFRES
jgi:AcrR family transcriptional regulator